MSQDAFKDQLAATAASLTDTLDALLSLPDGGEGRVVEAMRYAALEGGKRLRPYLVIESAKVFGVESSRAVAAAAAIEMIHCYSLVHDDLPSMDDDDLRRGRPTVHMAFDEATAILAGDGLLTRAFAVLADPATHADANVRSELSLVLANAAGSDGMVGGQMLDLLAQSESLNEAETERLQSLKTGCLLGAAAEFGAILGKASDQDRFAFQSFGLKLGAAFQIADDLLDLEASPQDAGKATGKDAAAGKATFISLYGADRARTQAWSLADQAIEMLGKFGAEADGLRAAARFSVDRQS